MFEYVIIELCVKLSPEATRMVSLQAAMVEYSTRLQAGVIQVAYRGLMDFMMDLRTQFAKQYPDYSVSTNIYYGYMDMTYFAVVPPALQVHKLKVAIVFLHDTFQFEAWLSGANRAAQKQALELIQTSGWDKYKRVPQGTGVDAALKHIIVGEPHFDDLDVGEHH